MPKVGQAGRGLAHALIALSLASLALPHHADAQPSAPAGFGPFDADVIAAAPALIKALDGYLVGERPSGQFARPPRVKDLPARDWTMAGWVWLQEAPSRPVGLAGIGDATNGKGRFLGLIDGKAALWVGGKAVLSGGPPLTSGAWHHVAASQLGTEARVWLDGAEVAHGTTSAPVPVPGQVMLGPRGLATPDDPGFAGKIAGFTDWEEAHDGAFIAALVAARPNFALVRFEEASTRWQVSTRQMIGQVAPQDAWTLPVSKAGFSAPRAVPADTGPALAAIGERDWRIGQWRLIAAQDVQADGAALSRPEFDASAWYAATVPGTVLTTLVDRGVYPDPDHGLNNMAIPETLNKQDWWYRTSFAAPSGAPDQALTLTFNGINYAAEIWLNGKRIGTTKGAFARGTFDVTGLLVPGANALAVKVSPPPHPGIAQEESIAAGPGENGGMQALDGPTFIASEGWDWIPSVRDRNTGLWQDVVFHASGPVSIGDAAVVTTLPLLPDTSRAEIAIDVPLANGAAKPVSVTLTASFDTVSVSKAITLAPGATVVRLTPDEFAQLRVANPKLWWPNGYGEPAMHTLRLAISADSSPSDSKDLRFGIREIGYEISLGDGAGHLRRVDYRPTLARAASASPVDVRHEAIRHVNGGFAAWAASIAAGAETSPAFAPAPESGVAPSLILKVNGVRIAARGGNWGMDDWRKRVSRERLEPYFRLSRDAGLNTIRNWQGQNSEEAFYDLADDYGLLIVNDFWESTQGYNLEASDTALFLANAADVMRRFRNHPSIAIWIGRNEGVPQPAINEGLAALAHDLDGTRHYSGASNFVNFGLGGPYAYQEPDYYFTYPWGVGFSMEVGLPSFPTKESFEAAIPAADLWPLSDAWAYHDWHQAGNGDTHGFMTAMEERFGAPKDLADFERKAQLMNYEAHRAVFEGLNAGLWTRASGRLLWMSQPAWPSTVWQIYGSDYDPNGSYFGVKSAAEAVHAQINLPGNEPAVINNRVVPLEAASLRVRILGLDGKLITERRDAVSVAAGGVMAYAPLDLATALARNGAVLIRLDLTDRAGKLLSTNLYWRTRDKGDGRKIADLAPQPVTLSARLSGEDSVERTIEARLSNRGDKAALGAKLTLLDADGSRVLPAYYSDNYVNLLPGERRTVSISVPASAATGPLRLALRGLDVIEANVPVAPR